MKANQIICYIREVQQRSYIPLSNEQRLQINQFCYDSCGVDCNEVLNNIEELLSEKV
jgi:hypothetical protein